MELTFEWDDRTKRLVRSPDAPLCTREQNMENSDRIAKLLGDDPVARATCEYEMACEAYENREWYYPCLTLPGGYGATWIRHPEPQHYRDVRTGMKIIASNLGNPQRLEKLLLEMPELGMARTLMDFVLRVTAVEAYNESCAQTLLFARATFLRLNPDGDATRIRLLEGLLFEWFGIEEPAADPLERSTQAARAAHRSDWLAESWRTVWSSP